MSAAYCLFIFSFLSAGFISVLILIAQQGADLEEKVKQMGAVAYFHKPFDPELLSSQINNLLNNN